VARADVHPRIHVRVQAWLAVGAAGVVPLVRNERLEARHGQGSVDEAFGRTLLGEPEGEAELLLLSPQPLQQRL